MPTTLRLFAPFLVAAGALSACLPGRDNPNDTSNRPVAALSIENGPFTGGVCQESDSIDEAFSRGRCLQLSAAGTTDPQGLDDIASFVFETSTNGEAGFVPVPDSVATFTSTALTMVLAPSVLRLHTPGREILVRVTVTDEAGGSSSADGRFKLTNTDPVALQPGNRYVPAFGALWRRSPSMTPGGEDVVGGGLFVRLDGYGVDDEDDPLLYCWRERTSDPWNPNLPCSPDALATMCDVTDSYVLDEVAEGGVSEEHKAIEYELRVCDGNAWSRAALASIVHESTPSWAVEEDFGRAVIVDAAARTEIFPYPVVGDPGFNVNQQDQVRAYFGYDDTATFGKDRNLIRAQFVADSAGQAATTLALPLDTVVRKILPANASNMLWVIAGVGSSGLGVYAVYGTGSTPSFDGPWLPPTDSPVNVGENDGIFAAVDGDTGDLWFSASLQQSVWGLAGDSGTIQEITQIDLADHFAGQARMVTGVALSDHAEPSTQGAHPVWVGHSKHVLVPGAGEPSGLLVRTPAGVIETFRLEVSPDVPDAEGAELEFGFGPLFASARTFYVSFFGEGVGYFAVTPQNDDVLMLSFAPTPLVGFTGAVHPASGHALFISDGQQTLLRTTPEGSSATLETSEPVSNVHRVFSGTRLLTFLPEGDSSPARLILGQGTGVEGLVQRFSIPPAFDRSLPAIDYSSGDLWVPTVIPTGAARFYADGRLADFIHSADDGTAAGAPFGAAFFVSADPADGALWLVTARDTSGNANVIWRVDPYGPRETAGIAAPGGVLGVELESATDTVLAMAAQPAVENTSSALVMLVRSDNGDGSFDYSVQRMLPSGVFDPPVPDVLGTGDPLPQPVFLARDLVEPGVCIAARNPFANQIAVRRYGPTLSSFDQVGIPTGSPPRVVAVAAYDGDCWIAYRAGVNVILALLRPAEPGFTTVQLPLPSEPVSIVPVITADSIRPAHSHRALLSFPEESVLRRYVITSNAGLALEADETIRTAGDMKLLTP